MTEKIYRKIAWKLPKKLVYWCAIRVWANATSGEWENEEAPSVTLDVALQRFL